MAETYFYVETNKGVIKGMKIENVQAVVFYPKGTDVTTVDLTKEVKVHSEPGPVIKTDNVAILDEDWISFRMKDAKTSVNFYAKDARRALEEFKIATGGRASQEPA